MEEKFKIKLTPQKLVPTESGTYYLDFLVSPNDKRVPNFKIAIELDGHEFHEKNKKQVAHDKQRERKLIAKGFTVLRFSGSEIFNNPRRCINEVADYIDGLIYSNK